MIRTLKPAEITPAFVELFNKLFDDSLNLDNLMSFVSDPDYFFFLDYQENELAGYCYGYFLRSARKRAWYAHMWSIEVLKKFQRRDIGTSLIDKVKELCRERGCNGFFLITQDDEEKALDFYAKVDGRQINDGLDRVVWVKTGLD